MYTHLLSLRPARTYLSSSFIWAILCAASWLAPSRSAAADQPPDASKWKLHMGTTVADTVTATRQQAYDAAVAVLHNDGWTIAAGRSDPERIVTDWKRLRHILVRLVAGEVRARCVVRVSPLGPTQTAVSIEGGLVTSSSAVASSVMGLAQHTYEMESRAYLTKVSTELEHLRAVAVRPRS
jgi:hypothetical protein